MRRLMAMAVVAFGLALATTAYACGGVAAEVLRALASDKTDPALIERLRDEGPTALDELFKLREQLQRAVTSARGAASQEHIVSLLRRQARLDEIIDQVGKQRYCSRSRLFWYTDFDRAREAALKSGKPILSLRMLGNLDEDFSCANSRFFRTTLYANEEVSKAMRENYVLHWKSVRPVPKVTIDFGDGRKLERTLTGNSIHYILTPGGDVVDALPGLYGPKAFLNKINEGASLARHIGGLSGTQRDEALTAYHTAQFNRLGEEWARDMDLVNQNRAASKVNNIEAIKAALGGGQAAPARPAGDPPAANVAARIARPKMRAEVGLIAAALPTAQVPEQLEDERTWNAVAALHAEDAKIDMASFELISSQNPNAAVAGKLAMTKAIVEMPMVKLVNALQSSIALDTVRNEYRLHRQLHAWYMDRNFRPTIDDLNERVYTELFLTPSSDPWLGLAPADVYTALPNSGVVQAAK
jgi:hypothetical protein